MGILITRLWHKGAVAPCLSVRTAHSWKPFLQKLWEKLYHILLLKNNVHINVQTRRVFLIACRQRNVMWILKKGSVSSDLICPYVNVTYCGNFDCGIPCFTTPLQAGRDVAKLDVAQLNASTKRFRVWEICTTRLLMKPSSSKCLLDLSLTVYSFIV